MQLAVILRISKNNTTEHRAKTPDEMQIWLSQFKRAPAKPGRNPIQVSKAPPIGKNLKLVWVDLYLTHFLVKISRFIYWKNQVWYYHIYAEQTIWWHLQNKSLETHHDSLHVLAFSSRVCNINNTSNCKQVCCRLSEAWLVRLWSLVIAPNYSSNYVSGQKTVPALIKHGGDQKPDCTFKTA